MTDRPRRVLILKPSSLGDVVTALGALGGLRRTFPDARLSWLVTPACAGILEGQDVDEVILFDRRRFGRLATRPAALAAFVRFCRDLRRRAFDWVLDLQGLFRSGFLTGVTGAPLRAGFADAREGAARFYNRPVATTAAHIVGRIHELLRALDVDVRDEDFRLRLSASAREHVQALLRRHGLARGGFCVLSPGTRGSSKVYPARHWAALAAGAAARGPVVLVGAPAEKAICEEIARAAPGTIDLAGQTTPAQLAALVAAAGALVACDSAASWVAPAVGTPFVTLMGPTRPERTGPWGPLGRALVADVPCQGCLKRSCRHVCCMQSIAPSAVLAVLSALPPKPPGAG